MSDFDEIPALGDAAVDEVEDDATALEFDEISTGGKYRFNGIYLFVTWSKSRIDCKDEFQQRLLPLLPSGVKYFGGRETHKDGTPHYHVVFRFENKTHWPNAAEHFRIDGDTNAIRFSKPRPRQPPRAFLENTMAYCAKDGDTFGERFSLDGPVAEQKKRKWQEVIDEPDSSKAWTLVRELEPRAYMLNYPALERAMAASKRLKSAVVERELPKGKFRVPMIMQLWLDRYVVRREWEGRPQSLVIVGDPLVGKSTWAESHGNPIVMNSGWCLKSIFPEATHIVVQDVRPAAFGYQGHSYWRDVLGGQASFNCRDFQQETRTVAWGKPCIWTCNFDNDPRKDPAVAAYLDKVAVVCEIRDRPGERCWGKLFTADGDVASKDVDNDWLKALAEMDWYNAGGCIDEAVDVSNEFGI